MTHVTWWRSSSDKKNLVFHLADNSVAVSQKKKEAIRFTDMREMMY